MLTDTPYLFAVVVNICTHPEVLPEEVQWNFDNLSPWEGMGKYLPGDEKSDHKND